MYLSDALAEPILLDLDQALKDIFWNEIRQYSRDSWPQILTTGKKLYDDIYVYLKKKISKGEKNF